MPLPKHILGAHMSIAGGYYRAVEQARSVGCDTVQIFSKNNNQWEGKPLTDDDVTLFREALVRHKIVSPVAHSSYLINLAAPDKELWQKSIDALLVELQRAGRLGIPYVIVHPGAFTTSSEARGLKRIAQAIDRIHRRVDDSDARILLENTAGQGSSLGWNFAQLGKLFELLKQPDQVGVCIDTCHAFAAGYDWRDAAGYDCTLAELEQHVGLDKVRAMHLNDSKRELGSRVDRHEHIGEGEIGRGGFRRILRDERLVHIPMYLETPKGEEDGEDLDHRNLAVLRKLARK